MTGEAADAPEPVWTSVHLVHAGDRDRLLAEVVGPLAVELLDEGVVDRFFFVRYSLGGPHLRVRIRHAPGLEEDLLERWRQPAEAFFRAHPSTPWPVERVEDVGRRILPNDAEAQAVTEVNDSVRRASFEPEVDRYGGAEHLAASLDYFHLSSLEVLRLVARYREELEGRRLVLGLVAALRQALGFAEDADGFAERVGQPIAYWGQRDSGLMDRGAEAYRQRGEQYRGLVAAEAERLLEADPSVGTAPEAPALVEPARGLGAALGAVARERRERIEVSQVHMGANRLGLRAVDECYLARILELAVADVADGEPALWAELDGLLRTRSTAPPVPFPTLDRRSRVALAPETAATPQETEP